VRRITIGVAVAVVAWIGWAALTLPPPSLRLRQPAAAAGGPALVRGVYHTHSRASDGTGTIPDIAAAAARAGLRFVIITDHGDGFRRPAPPRYIAGVLCIEAVEVSTTDGHYAALGMAPPPYPLGGEARDVVEDVARLGGFGVAAHPDSAKRALRWDAWDAPFDAMEWFNADSQWRDEPRWHLLPTLLQYPWRPTESVASLFDRPAGLLRRWDELTATRHVVGLAAADAHARMGLGGKTDPYDELLYVKVPSYESVFRAFSLGIELQAPLSGDAVADAGAVLAAIRRGRVYAAFDAIAGPAALSFTAGSDGHVARQGEDLAFDGPVRFLAATNAPAGSSLVLFRNGEPMRTVTAPDLDWTGDRPGTYRVEARVPGAPGDPPLPWIVSNPIYVGLPPRQGPAGAPAVHARLVLPAGSWQIEKDPGSSGSFDTAASGDLVRHTFRFQLGRGGRSPFVALVTRDVDPLRDAARIAFHAAATRPLRLSVQVRLVEGARERRWQRSVYLAPEPRDVVVSFDDMRTAGASERRPFQPAQIESLLLVFDTVNARPGDGGVVWVEGLRTER
jgi:hypothetical protein